MPNWSVLEKNNFKKIMTQVGVSNLRNSYEVRMTIEVN